MKTDSVPKMPCLRLSVCMAVALVTFGVLGLSGARANGVEPWREAVSLSSPETLRVDDALFSAKYFDWVDSERQRRVPAKLYLPIPPNAASSVPLVVFSHGIGGSRDGYSYLGRYFAAHGYASLHVQHVGSDRQLWFGNPFSLVGRLNDAAQEIEALHRVQDIRYSLDRILSSKEGALFNTQRIVAAGHSYGANTIMLIAGAQFERQGQKVSLRDPRISAAVIISAPPFYGMGSPQKILASIDVPTLHVTSTDDVIQIPGYVSGLQDRVEIFKATGNESGAAKVLAVFKEGSHSMFTDRFATGGLTLNPKVKIATRQLALAFMDAVQASDYQMVDTWLLTNADIVATFQRQVP